MHGCSRLKLLLPLFVSLSFLTSLSVFNLQYLGVNESRSHLDPRRASGRRCLRAAGKTPEASSGRVSLQRRRVKCYMFTALHFCLSIESKCRSLSSLSSGHQKLKKASILVLMISLQNYEEKNYDLALA